jgi:TonB family protein
MKLVARHVRVVTAGILLAMCSPIALGQINPRRLSKVQAGDTLQILSPTRGADFSGYCRELRATLSRKWIYLMPESFYMGDAGIVDIRAQVRADGTFVDADPRVERSSGKDALDAAAVGAIRASVPFPHFPNGFKCATIDLRISFFYNMPVRKPDPISVPEKSDVGGDSPSKSTQPLRTPIS